MAEPEPEWTLCKDNIQPLRGRVVTAQQQTLSQQEGPSAAAIQQQTRAFELELRTHSGDDQLDVWDRYLKWTLQTYPQGGKASNLTGILERAVRSFVDDKRYYNDARYVNLWIILAQNSMEPDSIYSYMQAQGIGVSQAALYIAWAKEYAKCGNFQRADAIFQDGLKCGAQPFDKLQKYHKAFQDRVSCQTMSGVADGARKEEEEGTPPKTCCVDLRPRGRSKSKKQPSQAASSTADPPRLPDLQPSAEESDQAPSVSECDTDPSVCRQPGEESVLDRPQAQQMQSQEEGGVKTQSMYCKEALMVGGVEFSIEELHAQRYFKKREQELDEKVKRLSKVEEELEQQIEKKKRLLLLRESQKLQQPQMGPDVPMAETNGHTSATRSRSDSGALIGQQPSVPFQIYDESRSDSGRDSNTENNTTDDVFLPPGERAFGLKIQYPVPYVKRITLPEGTQISKDISDRTEYQSEEAIVYSQYNKTLCATPDDTNDFERANKIESTPYTGTRGLRMMLPSISPIKEASNEEYSSVSCGPASIPSLGVQSGGKSTGHLSRLEESHADQEVMDQTSPSSCTVQSPPEDPSLSVTLRRRLLDQLDLATFPNFHAEARPLPTAEEGDVLSLGNKTFVISKIVDCENVSLYSGKYEEDFVLKVDRCTVPWEFYIASQLRQRLAREPQALAYDPGHCFLFQDGCVTVHSRKQCSLRQAAERWSDERCVAWLAVGLLELVRRMHSCSLVHGALNPDTLFLRKSVSGDPCEDVDIVAMDLTCSVDLELQKDVTSVKCLPASQPYIAQGLLEPSASPYQVDLMGVAETVHALLTSRSMNVVRDGSEWTLDEYREASGPTSKMFWSKFFRTILNPGDQPSVSVLKGLIGYIKMSNFSLFNLVEF